MTDELTETLDDRIERLERRVRYYEAADSPQYSYETFERNAAYRELYAAWDERKARDSKP